MAKARAKKAKQLGTEATKAQEKLFTKAITNQNFVKRPLISQRVGSQDIVVLNLNEDKMFVNLDNSYFLYNEKTKKLLYYGTLFDDKNPPKFESSNDIPWNEAN